MLKVKSTAIRMENGEVVTGKYPHTRHALIPANGKKGFLLSDGSFAKRKKAAKIAYRAGQIHDHIKKLHSHDLRQQDPQG